jgi:hypothetical protein
MTFNTERKVHDGASRYRRSERYAIERCDLAYGLTNMFLDSVSSNSILLKIPRKIRDLIYGYLHKPLSFSYKFPGMFSTATVEVSRAPSGNVLLPCSRLRDEYLESSVYAELTAVVQFDMFQERVQCSHYGLLL